MRLTVIICITLLEFVVVLPKDTAAVKPLKPCRKLRPVHFLMDLILIGPHYHTTKPAAVMKQSTFLSSCLYSCILFSQLNMKVLSFPSPWYSRYQQVCLDHSCLLKEWD